MKKKRYTVIIAMLALASMLAGCGSAGGEVSVPPIETETETTDENTPEMTDAPEPEETQNTEIPEPDGEMVMAKYLAYDADGNILYYVEYEYDGSGNQIRESRNNEDGSPEEWTEYEYDDTGNLVVQTSYYGDGSIIYIHGYEYDGAGNKQKQTYYSGDGSWSEWEYGAFGNIVKYISYAEDGSISSRSEYDEYGNVTKWVEYAGDGSIDYSHEYKYEYDESGNVVRSTKMSIDYYWGWSSQSEHEYEYDTSGNLIKVIDYNENGDVDSWTEYEYDTKGTQRKVTQYLLGVILYQSERDAAGNYTKDILYDMEDIYNRKDADMLEPGRFSHSEANRNSQFQTIKMTNSQTMIIKVLTSGTHLPCRTGSGQVQHLPRKDGASTEPVGTLCQPSMDIPNVNT